MSKEDLSNSLFFVVCQQGDVCYNFIITQIKNYATIFPCLYSAAIHPSDQLDSLLWQEIVTGNNEGSK